jgi:ornithine carbamoyltransferase
MSGLITLDDLDTPDLIRLVDRAVELHRDPTRHDRPLDGLVAGVMFLQTSTRTRTAFSAAALRLGAGLITFGPADLQLNTGESLEDTGRVFASMLDLLVVRTRGSSRQLVALSRDGELPVINAMSAEEHPTQAITDLATLRLRFGDLGGLSLLYVGEGNNSAVALAKGLSRYPGCRSVFWTPPGHGLPAILVKECHESAAARGGALVQITDRDELPDAVDVVYTTRWETTGTVKQDAGWREAFRPYYVDSELLARWPRALVMHDLPAHRGQEISAGALDGERSIAWTQAAMKLSGALAVLERAGGGRGAGARP